MKKIALISIAIVLVSVLSCTKETKLDVPSSSEEIQAQYNYIFESVSTKIVLPGGALDCVWEENDTVIVRDGAGNSEYAVLVDGAGQSVGKFECSSSMAPGTKVRLYYPYQADNGGATLPTDQVQPKTKIMNLVQGYSYSDEITLSADTPLRFTLHHPLAAVRVKFTSSEYDGSKVNGLVFRSIGNPVSGEFAVDYNTGVVTPGANTCDYVSLSLNNTASVSADAYNYVCFYALPSEVEQNYFVVLKIKGSTVSIPVEFRCQLKGGYVNEFVIDDLKLSDAPEWYRPDDGRKMPVLGYGFGEANTYLIQYKQSTYSDSVPVVEDASIPDEVEVDYRFTGDFRYAFKPDNVSFEFVQGYGGSGEWGVYTQDRSYAVDADKYEISTPANYKVKIKNVGAHSGSPVLVMKDVNTGKVLWAWVFWNIAADGTKLEGKPFGPVKIANMDIGQVSEKDVATETLMEMRRSIFYYQWGRPTPVFWQKTTMPYLGQSHPMNSTAPVFAAFGSGPISMEESLQHPGEMIIANLDSWDKASDTDEPADWLVEGSSHKDLWGSDGTKTIYDPCPKGWKVVDVNVYVDVFGTSSSSPLYSIDRYKIDDKGMFAGFYLDEDKTILMNNCGYVSPKYRSNLSLRNGGFSPTADNSSAGASLVWTNATNNAKGRSFRYDYFYTRYKGSSSGELANRQTRVVDNPRSYILPVRCMVDEDNL